MRVVKLLRPFRNINPGELAGFSDLEANWLVRNGLAEPAPGETPGEPDRQLVEPEVEVLGDTDERKAERDAYFERQKAPTGPQVNRMVSDAPRKGR
jgi:hypothetical protein